MVIYKVEIETLTQRGVQMRKNSASEKIKKEKKYIDLPRTNSYIPFLTGRPRRDTTINSDDLINLQIAFFTSKTLEDFLMDI